MHFSGTDIFRIYFLDKWLTCSCNFRTQKKSSFYIIREEVSELQNKKQRESFMIEIFIISILLFYIIHQVEEFTSSIFIVEIIKNIVQLLPLIIFL